MRFVSVLFLHFRRIPGESRAEQQPQRRISARVGCPAAAAELCPFLSRNFWALPSGFLFWALAQRFCSWALPVRLLLGPARNSVGSVRSNRFGPVHFRFDRFGSVGWFGPVRSRKAGLVQFDQSGLIMIKEM